MNNNVRWLTVSPVADDQAAYAAGDLIGGKLTLDLSAFRDTPGLMIQSVQIIDEDAQEAAIDVLLFDRDPDGTTFTDQAELDVDPSDLDQFVDVVSVAAADYVGFATNSIAVKRNLAIPLRADETSGTMQCWLALVSRGTPTYTDPGSLTVRVAVIVV